MVNEQPISLREGKVFLDGVQIMDAVKCTFVFQPEVWEGKSLGARAKSRRYIGHTITGTIAQRRSTPWLKEAIRTYIDTGRTPEFTIQGISDDKNSDYYAEYGSETVTATGCVLTGDIPLLSLDTDGDIAKDELSFGAHSIV